jgi:hypothetical protein
MSRLLECIQRHNTNCAKLRAPGSVPSTVGDATLYEEFRNSVIVGENIQ